MGRRNTREINDRLRFFAEKDQEYRRAQPAAENLGEGLARLVHLAQMAAPPAEYEQCFHRDVLPFLARDPLNRRCLRCGGKVYGRTDKEYCSAACAAIPRNRGRNTIKEKADRHWEMCVACQQGKSCAYRDALAAGRTPRSTDALSRRHPRMTPEEAYEMRAVSGRKRRRH
jgi:hypothetical protein